MEARRDQYQGFVETWVGVTRVCTSRGYYRHDLGASRLEVGRKSLAEAMSQECPSGLPSVDDELPYLQMSSSDVESFLEPGGEDVPAPSQGKRRAAKACEGCRRRKLRCDDGRPCGRCMEDLQECVEEDASARKRRRPSREETSGKPCDHCRESGLWCEETRPCWRCVIAGLSCTDKGEGGQGGGKGEGGEGEIVIEGNLGGAECKGQGEGEEVGEANLSFNEL
ncbi:hypothetical protein GUITHDRAFT_141516 [Guillardia theta CCMP2712]|uniref:Zn(2)-C6 fungal-type domain-containing protein n=1 Tax=Guillardia theta (strain CCMP2712) TaxID=905079 RepID=L1J0I2_GUITC|nr:hypothetical protein GUITHDRAFT_141516 [Guillardia theta CCMP2712]EKX42043.1 hypothetical protein GUITHDRAFT_141516 [Guillardia theta CCMP2712]|eukprot:XP_005829023.1 hypothetical protein GUITHDRAFT_141516 [Guillardia theta CCMP2712]